jgi:adenylate kinase family enzyme
MVGVSGSGKSTVGRELARRLAVPYTELDSIFHQPDWVPLPKDEFRRRVTALAAESAWVIDGNYGTIQPLIWQRADTVIWLDPPRHTMMRRLVWRSLRRVVGRTELWNGNRERWRNLFTWDPEESVISYAWRRFPEYRQRYAAAAGDPRHAHITFHRITSPADARLLLDAAGPLKPRA